MSVKMIVATPAGTLSKKDSAVVKLPNDCINCDVLKALGRPLICILILIIPRITR